MSSACGLRITGTSCLYAYLAEWGCCFTWRLQEVLGGLWGRPQGIPETSFWNAQFPEGEEIPSPNAFQRTLLYR